jgi:hypothetical protein
MTEIGHSCMHHAETLIIIAWAVDFSYFVHQAARLDKLNRSDCHLDAAEKNEQDLPHFSLNFKL